VEIEQGIEGREPKRRRAVHKNRWVMVEMIRYPPPEAGRDWLRLEIDADFASGGGHASTAGFLPTPEEPRDEWAVSLAAAAVRSVVRVATRSAFPDDLTQPYRESPEQQQTVEERGNRAYEAVLALDTTPWTPQEWQDAAARWSTDGPAEAALALALERGLDAAAVALIDTAPDLAGDLASIAAWLQGEPLSWQRVGSVKKICPECGRVFAVWRKDQRYCSVRCSQRVRSRESKRRKRRKTT
jgi:hypothetical protein